MTQRHNPGRHHPDEIQSSIKILHLTDFDPSKLLTGAAARAIPITNRHLEPGSVSKPSASGQYTAQKTIALWYYKSSS